LLWFVRNVGQTLKVSYANVIFGDKMEIITLNEKGQITIPARIRKSRGLAKGVRVALIEIGDRLELVAMPEDPIRELIGLGKNLPSIGEIEAEADVE